MSQHEAQVIWQRGDAVFSDGKYSRVHLLQFDGGASFAGSPAPTSVRPPLSDEAAIDPEEMLLAATGSCHMLWFLDIARRAGFVVDSYHDKVTGSLGPLADGRVGFTAITLAPTIVFVGDAPNADILAGLHDKAHHACFIANSLSCPVTIAGLAQP